MNPLFGERKDTSSLQGRFFNLLVPGVFAAILLSGLIALGVWQVQRLFWKQALILRVIERVQDPPHAPPEKAFWPRMNRLNSEYLRVRLSGHYLKGRDVLVTASTDLGPGFWVLSPLIEDQGDIVWVNRGFIPHDLRYQSQIWRVPQGTVRLTGLIRMTEPGGGFLRPNRPSQHLWYSRDVVAMTNIMSLDLKLTAPYFVDEEGASSSQTLKRPWPRAGLTIIHFPNNHLVYAMTWFGLALVWAGGIYWVIKSNLKDMAKVPLNIDGS